MPTYDIIVTRDDNWWIITVPGLDRYAAADGSINVSDTTQARFPGQIDDMARDFIAVVTATPSRTSKCGASTSCLPLGRPATLAPTAA